MAQTLEQKIRKVIKQHYGDALWTFRPDTTYRGATRAFVADVAKAIRDELRFTIDLPHEMAKYIKAGGVDRGVGDEIRNLRTKRGVSREQHAAAIGYNPNFLEALEDGKIAATVDMYCDAFDALKPNKKEDNAFAGRIASYKTPESIIRDVVEFYYGRNLWMFHPELEYEQAIEPFVEALVALGHAASN